MQDLLPCRAPVVDAMALCSPQVESIGPAAEIYDLNIFAGNGLGLVCPRGSHQANGEQTNEYPPLHGTLKRNTRKTPLIRSNSSVVGDDFMDRLLTDSMMIAMFVMSSFRCKMC